MTAAVAPHWFVAPKPYPDAPVALFCLPYAGAGAAVFRGWAEAFGPDVDVAAVALPGRESRFTEPPEVDVAAVATAIARRAGTRPYALYGHSMGARLGFEVIHELIARRAPLPVRLYVGGSRPPDLPDPLAGLSLASDDELLNRLAGLGGLSADVLAERELCELLLPMIRADFRWLDDTEYEPRPPVPVPIRAFAGATDPLATPLDMLCWLRHAGAGFTLRTEPGDHFFLHAGLHRLASAIRADLGGASPVGPVAWPDDDEVHLWYARLDELPGLAEATTELSPRELAHALRLRRDSDRTRYVARGVLLRRLLARYGVPVGTAELSTGRGGKPQLATGDLRFNVSHSSGVALVALTRGHEVGVDVERLVPMVKPDAFQAGALHPDERVAYLRLAEPDRLAHALRLWTAKEAVLKGTGDGLGVEPSHLSFAGQPAGAQWRARVPPELARLADWRVTHLPLPGAIGAVAQRRDGWRLRLSTVDSAGVATPAGTVGSP